MTQPFDQREIADRRRLVEAFRDGLGYSARDAGGVKRYAAYVRAEFEAYTRTPAKYYGEERRWQDSLFWQRRTGPFGAARAETRPAPAP